MAGDNTDPLEVFVLGTIAVRAGADPIALDRRLERALAVRLALERGAKVPDDRLARDLWGDVELARPVQRLSVLSSRLRTALGTAGGALRRVAGGYTLTADPVDLAAAETAVARLRVAQRDADPAGLRAAADAALTRWRGPALADLRDLPFGAAEGTRLDELRLEIQLERAGAGLALGEGVGLVTELARLAGEHPLHERLARLLALALYRAGRQADAVDRIARLRRALADQLGMDPAPETVAMELKLLRQDPTLAAGPPDQPDQPARAAGAGRPEIRLPDRATTFRGRDAEQADLLDRLGAPGLATVTGPAGSGKTRLAIEVARAVQRSGRPVALVELAPVPDPAGVGSALAAAAGVEEAAGDPVPRCAAALAGALLVLDNAEHLIEPVATAVAALLRHSPGLSVLVTSQRPLLLSAEHVYRLGPLPPAAALALFGELNRAPDDPDPASVAVICAAVDRLPLGIELAAGLTRTLSVRQLAHRIDDRLRLLIGGSRDSGARHTSLRAALDWSYDLLGPAEQAVLRRLATFVGGCTLEAAEQVLAFGELDRSGIAAALTDLTDRCLVTASHDAGGTIRFDLPETVRLYALGKLATAGEQDITWSRHLHWCTAHVTAHVIDGADEVAALAAVVAEWPNLLAALEHAPGTGRAAGALRLAVALDDAWVVRGLLDQAVHHYAALIEAPGASDDERAAALSNYGFASAQLGQTAGAVALLDRAAGLAAATGNDALAMRVLYHRAIAEIEGGWPARAFEPLRQGRELADRIGRRTAAPAFLDVLGTAHLHSGDIGTALEICHQGLRMDRELGYDYDHGLARGLINEALVLLSAGRVDEAVDRAAEADRYARRLADAVTSMNARMIHGRAALLRADTGTAIEAFRTALRDAGTTTDAQLIRLDLAEALVRAGRAAPARELLARVLDGIGDRGLVWLVAQPTVAALAAAGGDPGTAAGIVVRTRDEYARREFNWPHAVDRLDRVRAVLDRGA